MNARIRAGVLALQGDVREHLTVLSALGADAVPVRTPEQLAGVDALVIPGGESSVMDKLSRRFGLAEPLRGAIAGGLPVLGTCAGLIMLADRLRDAIDGQETWGGLDVTVRRNAFGRQTESFECVLDVPVLEGPPVQATFIRGPVIEECGAGAVPLAALEDGRIVAVEQGVMLGLSFHPELTGEMRFHERLLAHAAHRTSLATLATTHA